MKNKFLELDKKAKITVILFSICLLGLFIILVGQSYAIFSGTTIDTKEQIVKLGNLEVKLNEPSSGIDLGLSSMSDVEGLLQEEVYTFSVENTGSANAMYRIYLIDDETSKASYTGTLLDKSLIKLGLELNGKELGPFTLSELNELLNEKELKKGNKDTYKLRLWISEDADLDSIVDDQIFLKLKLEAEQYFGVTTPALTFAESKVGTDGLETVTHTIDSTLQVGSEFATEYRYRGGSVNNYVTFNNETWRIIGILPTEDTDGNVKYRFKIIRDTSLGDMYWNETQDTITSSYNNWVAADLNTYLNGTYYNSLSSDAQSMIGTAKYYLGGYSTNSVKTDVMWQYERKNDANRSGYYYDTNPVVQSDESKKIALMYASDYGYAAPTTCTSTLANYNTDACKTTNNWLDKSQYEWSITQRSSVNSSSFIVFDSGFVSYNGGVKSDMVGVRPVLYLTSKVKIKSGSGTSSDPYILSEK